MDAHTLMILKKLTNDMSMEDLLKEKKELEIDIDRIISHNFPNETMQAINIERLIYQESEIFDDYDYVDLFSDAKKRIQKLKEKRISKNKFSSDIYHELEFEQRFQHGSYYFKQLNYQIYRLAMIYQKIATERYTKLSKDDPDYDRTVEIMVDAYKRQIDRFESTDEKENMKNEYDFFICHSSDDKEKLVRPLADELRKLGIKVWFDEFELKIGDSLRQSIDVGLRNSKYGLVVFSKSFFDRSWTNYELNGFVNKEMNGSKVIMPIWHEVSREEVQEFSYSLADKLALETSQFSIYELAYQLSLLLSSENT